jgi:hypothetical protein
MYQDVVLEKLSISPKAVDLEFLLRNSSLRVFTSYNIARNNVGVLEKPIKINEFVEMCGSVKRVIQKSKILRSALAHS